MVIYTDDCLIFAKEDSTIDSLLAELNKTYLLEDQGNVQDYLGIRITTDDTTKTITMLQTGLIESIISDVGLSLTSNTKTTPADSVLHSDPTKTPRQELWNYRSVLGKLIFWPRIPGLTLASPYINVRDFVPIPQPSMSLL